MLLSCILVQPASRSRIRVEDHCTISQSMYQKDIFCKMEKGISVVVIRKEMIKLTPCYYFSIHTYHVLLIEDICTEHM